MSVQAYGNFLLDKGYDVSDSISIFTFVKSTGPGTVGPVTATTDIPLGVAQFHVTAAELTKGKGASVRMDGISEVYCTGTPALGDQAGLNADGTVRTAQTGDRVVGQFRSAGINGGRAAVAIDLPGHIA